MHTIGMLKGQTFSHQRPSGIHARIREFRTDSCSRHTLKVIITVSCVSYVHACVYGRVGL